MMNDFKKNYSLFDETTFKIGGKAELFLDVKSQKELLEAIKKAEELNLKVTIIGGGSNVLVSSDGVSGLVIKMSGKAIDFLSNEKGLIKVEAGVGLPQFSRFCLDNSLEGMEWAMGIPGTVGGAIYGNAGAFGDSISDFIEEVEVLEKLEKKILQKDEISFGYRSSTFKEKDLIILSALFKLNKGQKERIEEKTDKYLNHRKNNHPIEAFSAGSIFKNPEIKIEDADLIKEFPKLSQFNERGVIPAGYLIENVKMRGFRVGGAKISEKHCNFIINENKATSDDVKNLIKKVQQEVFKKFKINLITEIRYID